MVGAGGIGCELLKNLVLAGFHDIVIVSCKQTLLYIDNILKLQAVCR